MITGLAPPAADVDPPAPADAPDASEPDDAEPARPGWLPAPRATAVAILSMLAFGVVAGSLVKPEAESLARTYVVAMPPAATTPAATPAADSGSSSDGGGGGGGGGGRRLLLRIGIGVGIERSGGFVGHRRGHAAARHGHRRPGHR